MAKLVPDTNLDTMLDHLEGTNIHVCEDPAPTNWAGVAAVELAAQVIVGAYASADGDVSGRKTTCPAQSGANTLDITKTGTATTIAITDGSSELFCTTTCTPQLLTISGTVDVPAWDAELGDPT